MEQNKDIKGVSILISGFPGVGKSYFAEVSKGFCLDLESSDFSHKLVDGKRVKDPDFPNNYIEEIERNIGEYEVILISSHEEVRAALGEREISFNVAYPTIDRKEEFLERYRRRGNTKEFVELISKNWEKFIAEIEENKLKLPSSLCNLVPFVKGDLDYISDLIKLPEEE